ncbi:hypothetical protein KKB40_03730, partial [Patescibacteria group bacterium]|nr:hypothetical protein [Patescibacteria group bacterium]
MNDFERGQIAPATRTATQPDSEKPGGVKVIVGKDPTTMTPPSEYESTNATMTYEEAKALCDLGPDFAELEALSPAKRLERLMDNLYTAAQTAAETGGGIRRNDRGERIGHTETEHIGKFTRLTYYSLDETRAKAIFLTMEGNTEPFTSRLQFPTGKGKEARVDWHRKRERRGG